jgi:hypothetical protein
MKTAEEWITVEPLNILDGELPLHQIRRIQLDAFKAGERFAAEKLDEVTAAGEDSYSMRESCQEAILTDANNRNTLP